MNHSPANNRIASIDVTRGLVMVIMALDHVREFLHTTSMTIDPLDLQKTTYALFFTRWITHLCAPAFVFLAGISAFLYYRRTNCNIKETRKFLLTRGIVLVILEFTLINFALWTDIRFRMVIMEVIAATGLSFIVLSFLIGLSSRTIGIAGLVLIFSHNILQGVSFVPGTFASGLVSILFHPGIIDAVPGHSILVSYPLVPWLGIMLAGYGTGELFRLSITGRKLILFSSGIICLLLFTILRSLNVYGDPSGLKSQQDVWMYILSFINVTKYPPSLLFTLLFTGLTLIILSIAESSGNKISRFLSVFGKVPFFYFIVHLFLIHAIMFIVLFIQGYGIHDFVFGAMKNGRPATGGGVGLGLTYLVWLGVVIVLYPVCKWYGRYKSEHSEKRWIKYL